MKKLFSRMSDWIGPAFIEDWILIIISIAGLVAAIIFLSYALLDFFKK